MEKNIPYDDYFPCVPERDCKYFSTNQGCREDVHHLYYPQSEYTTPLERRFWKLNKIVACRRFHDLIHQIVPDVEKPSEEFMQEYLNARKAR